MKKNNPPAGRSPIRRFTLTLLPFILATIIVASPAAAPAGPDPDKISAEAARNWLQANAIRLDTVEAGHGFADMQPLKKVVGDARIVALGEATHGTREFFLLKHRMLEFLAAEMGFTIFAIEANMPESYRLNEYVLNDRGDPAELIRGMHFWTWQTEEVLAMVRWMREFNHSGRGRVQFTGFDMQFPDIAAKIVNDFVSRFDPGFSATVSQAIARVMESTGRSTFGVATGSFPVNDAKGRRVRFSGFIKTENIHTGYAGLWWRVDGQAGVLAFDNMRNRGVSGTSDWKRCDIELAVPANATHINFGAILAGDGTAWFDGLAIELDGKPYRSHPSCDLGFESPTPEGFYVGGPGYAAEMDLQVHREGKQSLRLQRTPSAAKKPEDAATELSAWKGIVRHLESFRESNGQKGVSPREAEWAMQNARVVLQFLQMRAKEVTRDQSMAENVQWILASNPGAKIMLWAHNGHVATAGMASFEPMGMVLRRLFGPQMVVFGFAFNQGSFQAIEMPFAEKGGLRTFTVEPAPKGSLDAMLAETGLPIAAIDLRRLPREGPVADWFSQPKASRSIGSGYSDSSAAFFFTRQIVPKTYDALLFVEKTNAAKALPGTQ